jgi:hypothetical protein
MINDFAGPAAVSIVAHGFESPLGPKGVTKFQQSAACKCLWIALKPWLAVLPFRGKSKTGGIRHLNLGQRLRVHHFVFVDDSALEQQESSQGIYFVGLK